MNTKTAYLTADAAHPLVSNECIWDELLLYHISGAQTAALYAAFEQICGKSIDEHSHIGQLSGGQKVILMACLAVYSPASRIRFIGLEHSVDPSKMLVLQSLLQSSGKEISYEDNA